MKIIAFGASSSRQSINKALASYTASLIDGAEVTVLDLNDFDMPIFSEDKEKEFGIPNEAQAFVDAIAQADLIIASFSEHNGSYSAAYKNVFDWASRIEKAVYQDKPIVALSTSPGPGGASSVLAQAVNSMPFFKGNVVGSLSVPNFYDAMKDGEIVDASVKQSIQDILSKV
ncbi:FMN-dependent NADPH-azoreductase [Marinomonas spartinae]|uniref:FMN-dependent NADPH-azoreductase n=1 Tax=Marinomonas spartinae TaxID=1792290 RepID=A0A1A8TD44_9GAMM|nr:NAD(P)H-dependent oxidoreductase [Marinomonas spartinae]SBS30234.1 FMN-dependent NADPH-azoreductase [Marinomonas spartinae]SBS36843.1 FMN-dependent NADPH-azoreductase [Marinomonas spartinae]